MPNEKHIQAMITEELHAELRTMAIEGGLTFRDIIELALAEFFDGLLADGARRLGRVKDRIRAKTGKSWPQDF